MRCPYCRNDIRVSGRFCPRCGRQIFGLPANAQGAPGAPADQGGPPAAPVGPPPMPTASGVVASPASPDVVGKTCPYDQYPIASGDQVIVCPECGVPHHADCWLENGGCTTYGCIRAPSAQPVAQPAAYPRGVPSSGAYAQSPGVYQGLPQDQPLSGLGLMAAEIDRKATNALLYTLIGLPCCPVLSIVGFFLAISVFAALGNTSIKSPSARIKATWAVVVGVVAPIGWIVLIVAAGGTGGSYP